MITLGLHTAPEAKQCFKLAIAGNPQNDIVATVTGTSTGFGRFMAEYVLENGGNVVATLRRPEAISDLAARYGKERLLVVKLDVTVPSEIPTAFKQGIETFGRIDVVFNNAGAALISETEITPEEDARKLFDTNYWGAVNVSREAVRVFREVNPPGAGGRLIQNSSMAGFGALPLLGQYVAAKHALEGFTKTLALELDPRWNIKITLVEAGFFQTEIARQSTIVPVHATYNNDTAVVFRAALAGGELPGDIHKAVATIWKVAQLENPPLNFPLGLDSVRVMKAAGELLVSTAAKYESWSQDLLREEMGEGAKMIKNAFA